jgi:hypothetical protein
LNLDEEDAKFGNAVEEEEVSESDRVSEGIPLFHCLHPQSLRLLTRYTTPDTDEET